VGRNVSASKRGWGWDAANQRLVLYVNGTAVEYYDEPVGRTYYVNNVTGDSGGDGLSWDTAFDQVDAAFDASETYRLSQTSSNRAVRNRIFVQGTETAYDISNSRLNCCDVYGLGSRGMIGTGLSAVVIGDGSTAAGITFGAAGFTSLASGGGAAVGVNLHNVNFAFGGAFWGMNVVDFLLGSLEDVNFVNSGANGNGGLCCTEHFAGNIMRWCSAYGDTGNLATGFQFTGGVFNSNKIEHCSSSGRTYGWYNTDYLQNGSVIKNCVFSGATYGIYDTGGGGAYLSGAVYVDNVGTSSGGTGIAITNGNYRAFRNVSDSAQTIAIYYAYT